LGHRGLLGRVQYIADHHGGSSTQEVLDLVVLVLEAGISSVQVRCKACPDRDRYELAKSAVALCRAAGATCLVNDRVDIALAAGADGAHVGSEDLPVAVARRLLGPSAVLGVTARSPEEALAAERDGADYIGAGPCYATSTKAGLPAPIGPEGLAAIAGAVSIPVFAIGGVSAAALSELFAAGAYGAAVISAVASAPNPTAAARELVASARALASASAPVGAR
jgi:thiamine-phosphate pyrophosphorylase